jgi:hypothetical protein
VLQYSLAHGSHCQVEFRWQKQNYVGSLGSICKTRLAAKAAGNLSTAQFAALHLASTMPESLLSKKPAFADLK